MRVLKYLISGGIGVSVNLGVLYWLVHFLGTHYLIGSVVAMTVSTTVGFILQKYWTFEERSHEQVPIQFFWYAVLALCNIGINTGIVYVLSGVLGVHYLISQFVGAGAVAVVSFFVYQHFIFTRAVKRDGFSGATPL